MQIGLELVAEKVLPVVDGDRFDMYLSEDHRVLSETRGSDTYHQNGHILTGKRVAGSGRDAHIGYGSLFGGLGVLEAPPAATADIDPEHVCRLRLHIKTNAILDPGLVLAELGLRVIDPNGRPLANVPFQSPDVSIDWPSRGEFIVNVTPHLRDLALAGGPGR